MLRFISTVATKLNTEPYHKYVQSINQKYAIAPTLNTDRNSRRVGLVTYKQGMTSLWDKWGLLLPCTVLQVDRAQIMQVRPHPVHASLFLCQIGSGYRDHYKLNKPQIGHFLKYNVPPKKDIVEFTITKEGVLPVGYMLPTRHFNVGQFVDAIAISKGKGFQGYSDN